jgi:TATA-binding protein-associated factor
MILFLMLITCRLWNRAHRLGQKKVVNVQRMIMRGTLEEKVMSLQQFKVSVANAVINAESVRHGSA